MHSTHLSSSPNLSSEGPTVSRAKFTDDVSGRPYAVATRVAAMEVRTGRKTRTEMVPVYCAWRDLGDTIQMSSPSRWGATDVTAMLNSGYCPMTAGMLTLDDAELMNRERALWSNAK